MTRDQIAEAQAAKDTLFRLGLLNSSQNHALQSKLDRLAKAPWVVKSGWGAGRNSKARTK